MNQGPDISLFAIVSIVVLAAIGMIALTLGVLAGIDALLTHLQWVP